MNTFYDDSIFCQIESGLATNRSWCLFAWTILMISIRFGSSILASKSLDLVLNLYGGDQIWKTKQNSNRHILFLEQSTASLSHFVLCRDETFCRDENSICDVTSATDRPLPVLKRFDSVLLQSIAFRVSRSKLFTRTFESLLSFSLFLTFPSRIFSELFSHRFIRFVLQPNSPLNFPAINSVPAYC